MPLARREALGLRGLLARKGLRVLLAQLVPRARPVRLARLAPRDLPVSPVAPGPKDLRETSDLQVQLAHRERPGLLDRRERLGPKVRPEMLDRPEAQARKAPKVHRVSQVRLVLLDRRDLLAL